MPSIAQLRDMYPDAKDASDAEILDWVSQRTGMDIQDTAQMFGVTPGKKRGAIGAGFSSGIDELQGLGYSAGAALADVAGADKARDWLNKRADVNALESRIAGRPELERVEDQSLSSALPYLGYQVAKQIPNVVGAIGMGMVAPEAAVPAALSRAGALLPRALGGGGLEAGASVAARRAASEAGQTFGKQIVGGAAFNEGQAVGSLYQSAREGGDENAGRTALLASPAYALAETLPEAMLVGRLAHGSGFTGNLLQRTLKAGATQGATGATSEILQTGMEQAVGKELTSEEARSQYLNAGVAGGLVEGLLGMPGGIRSRAPAILPGSNQAPAPAGQPSGEISQAVKQKDIAQPDITTQQFQTPAMREHVTEDGEIVQVPVAQMQQPAVSGGTTEIAQAQQQAQQQAAQQQAQAQQAQAAQQAAQQFGVVNPATPAVGSAFGQKVYGPNIPAVANAIATFTSKMPEQQVQLAQAITKANAETGGQLIKYKFNANDVMASVDKGFQAVGKVANQFQIAHVDSVDEAAAILNDQSTQLKGDKLEQVNAIHQALTGQDTTGYQAEQLAKGAKNGKLQLQNNAGLREVPVEGGTRKTGDERTGLVRPTEVQPIGAGSVGAGPLGLQTGQLPTSGVRPAANAGPSVGVSEPVGSGQGQGQVNAQAAQATVPSAAQVTGERLANENLGAVPPVQQEQAAEEQRVEEVPDLIRSALRMIYKSDRKVDLLLLLTEKTQRGDYAALAKEYGVTVQYVKELASEAVTDKGESFPRFITKHIDQFMAAVNAQAERSGISVLEALDALQVIHDAYEGGLAAQQGTEINEGDLINAGLEIQNVKERTDNQGKGTGKVDRTNVSDLAEEGNKMEALMQQYLDLSNELEAATEANDERVQDLEKQVADLTTKIAEAEKKEKARVREMAGKQAPKEPENAVQVESPEEVPVRKRAGGSEAVGKRNAEGRKATRESGEEKTKHRVTFEGKAATVTIVRNKATPEKIEAVTVKPDGEGFAALNLGPQGVVSNEKMLASMVEGDIIDAVTEPKQEEIKTPQEQYEALAASTNLLPPYEALDARERAQVEDQAHQGTLTLASLNTMFSGNAKFGKDVRAKNPYTAAELTKEIEDFVRTSVSARKLTVVNSVEDLTNSSDKVVQQIGAVLAIEGAYGVAVNGRAYLIANRIEKGMGRAKFMHEVGAHLGLENLLPKATYDRLVAQIKNWTNSDADTNEVTLAARAEMRVLNANTPAVDYDAELLAYFIEEAVQAGIDPTATVKESSALREWFRTLWAAFKVAVRRLGYNPESMTAQDVVDMAFGAARLEMSGVYHGTAASFRNFRNKYIGSGEGATAYGWGTYLAERYGIAKGYHEADVRRKTKEAKPEGNLMRVDTAVADDELFNYNAVVADQPPRVRDAIKSLLDPIADEVVDRTNTDVDELTGRDLFGTGENDLGLLSRLIMDDVLVGKGAAFDKAVQQGEFHKAASLLLEEAGIAGIKHLDARSRGTATKVIQFRGKSYNRDELRDAARAAYAAKDDKLTFEMGMLRSLLQNGVAHVRAMHESKQAYYERMFYKTDKESAEKFKVPFDEEQARADAKRKTKDLFETKALDWLDKHESEISLAENPRTYNRILFSDKNIFRVGSQVAADRQRMRFGKEASQPAGVFAKAGEWLDAAITSPKETLHKLKLGFLTLDQLAELDKSPGQVVRAYSDVMTAMQKTSKDLVYKAAQIDQLWAKLSQKDSDNVSQVMRDATRAKFDPSLGVAGKNEAEDAIMNAYRALPSSAKDVYAKVKKHYEDSFKLRLAIMEESAAKLGGKELKEIQELYSKLKGPYFPLGRTGRYYAVGMSPRVAELTAKKEAEGLSSAETTELSGLRKQANQYKTSSFNTLYEAKKAAEEFKKSMGDSYYNEVEENIESAMSKMPNFAKLEESITTKLGGETRAEVKSMLSQLMFDSLPEHHALKNQMRREGIYGENEDMRQVFAQTSISQAHYISRLQFGGELNQAMLDIAKTARKDIEMRQIQNELKLRTKLSMDNTQSALTDAMVNASYFAHLGLSPAFLLTNMTQVPMITAPWLGARHGVGATKRAMAMALADTAKIIKSTYKDGDWRSELNWNNLFPAGSNEDRMFRDLLDRNVLDITMEHDLAAVASAQKGIFDDKISKATGGKLGGMSDVVKLVNTPVRITELANRAVTALSSYRLKMESLKSAPMTEEERHTAAVNYAARAVSETQLNYSELNAPRHMRQVFGSKPLAKMIFQFRKYQQGMLYLIAKNISDALPGSKATAEDRRIARRTIAGLYMTTGLMAGTTGMPLMGTVGVAGIANLIAAAFGDEDEPWDFETEYRNFLADWLGKDMALLVAKGVPAVLGADLSQRVGMADIANPIPFVQRGATGQSTVANVLYAAGGAPIGMVGTMYDGIVAMANGDVMKGMEKVIPVKAVKDALRTYRYADEGMTDKRGNVILPPEKFDAWDLTLRGMGFTPTKESEYYAANAAMQEAKMAATDVRTRLLREYSEAKMKGEPTTDVDAEIAAFNERHPEKTVKIDMSTKLKAVQARRKMATERNEAGLRIGKREKPFADQARFATEE